MVGPGRVLCLSVHFFDRCRVGCIWYLFFGSQLRHPTPEILLNTLILQVEKGDVLIAEWRAHAFWSLDWYRIGTSIRVRAIAPSPSTFYLPIAHLLALSGWIEWMGQRHFCPSACECCSSRAWPNSVFSAYRIPPCLHALREHGGGGFRTIHLLSRLHCEPILQWKGD